MGGVRVGVHESGDGTSLGEQQEDAFFLSCLTPAEHSGCPSRGSTLVFQKTEEERLTGLYLYNFLMFV